MLGGMVARLEVRAIRSGVNEGRRMAVCVLDDMAGSIEAVAFPDVYARHVDDLVPDAGVFLCGRLNLRRDEPSVVIDEVVPIGRARAELTTELRIDLPASRAGDELLGELETVLRGHPGRCPLLVRVATDAGTAVVRAADDRCVAVDDALLEALQDLLGADGVHPVPRRGPFAGRRRPSG